jgi:hypothetical protein
MFDLPVEVLYAIGTLILGVAIAWGVMWNMGRNRANDRVTEKATHDLYADPDHYDERREAELKRQVRPS